MDWIIGILSTIPYLIGFVVGFYFGKEYEQYKNHKENNKWDQDVL